MSQCVSYLLLEEYIAPCRGALRFTATTLSSITAGLTPAAAVAAITDAVALTTLLGVILAVLGVILGELVVDLEEDDEAVLMLDVDCVLAR